MHLRSYSATLGSKMDTKSVPLNQTRKNIGPRTAPWETPAVIISYPQSVQIQRRPGVLVWWLRDGSRACHGPRVGVSDGLCNGRVWLRLRSRRCTAPCVRYTVPCGNGHPILREERYACRDDSRMVSCPLVRTVTPVLFKNVAFELAQPLNRLRINLLANNPSLSLKVKKY